MSRSVGPDGKIMHAELKIGNSRFMMNDVMMGGTGPQAFGGSPEDVVRDEVVRGDDRLDLLGDEADVAAGRFRESIPLGSHVGYAGSMKKKTSITLSGETLAALARATRKGETRSEAIERLLRERLAAQARQDADRRELERINAHAEDLNAEAADVLAYQVEL